MKTTCGSSRHASSNLVAPFLRLVAVVAVAVWVVGCAPEDGVTVTSDLLSAPSEDQTNNVAHGSAAVGQNEPDEHADGVGDGGEGPAPATTSTSVPADGVGDGGEGPAPATTSTSVPVGDVGDVGDVGGGDSPGDGQPGPGGGEADGEPPVVDELPTGRGDGSSPLVEGDRVGPLLWWPVSPWVAVVDEIFDLCDDHEALTAVTGRVLGPGDEITAYEWQKIEDHRRLVEVSCVDDADTAKRYVVMTDTGPGPVAGSPQGAREALERRYRASPKLGLLQPSSPGFMLGYLAISPYYVYHVEEPVDEVVVLTRSVAVRDGVLRGLVQNMSAALFARDLTVSVGDSRWQFPLTVQPSELAPFEIEDYTGTTDPDEIDFKVSASLSPAPDLTRSITLEDVPGYWTGTWNEFQADGFPSFGVVAPPNGKFTYFSTVASYFAPTSHPSLADKVMNQTIENLRAYVTFLDDWEGQGKVIEVIETVPYAWLPTDQTHERSEWVKIPHLPYKWDPDAGELLGVPVGGELVVGFLVEGYHIIQMGSVN